MVCGCIFMWIMAFQNSTLGSHKTHYFGWHTLLVTLLQAASSLDFHFHSVFPLSLGPQLLPHTGQFISSYFQLLDFPCFTPRLKTLTWVFFHAHYILSKGNSFTPVVQPPLHPFTQEEQRLIHTSGFCLPTFPHVELSLRFKTHSPKSSKPYLPNPLQTHHCVVIVSSTIAVQSLSVLITAIHIAAWSYKTFYCITSLQQNPLSPLPAEWTMPQPNLVNVPMCLFPLVMPFPMSTLHLHWPL